MEFDRVSAKTDVVRRIGFVSKSQLEAKLLGIKLNRPPDVARAKNRVGFFEHCRSQTRGRWLCAPCLLPRSVTSGSWSAAAGLVGQPRSAVVASRARRPQAERARYPPVLACIEACPVLGGVGATLQNRSAKPYSLVRLVS